MMTEDQLKAILNSALAAQSEQLRKDFRSELNNEIGPLAETIAHIYNLLDDDAKGRSDELDERAAIDSAQNRHKDWIIQLAKHTKTRLVPEP